MEWYETKDVLSRSVVNGTGLFTGEQDILVGEEFIQTLLNEGFYVGYRYIQDGLEIKFSTCSTDI